MFIDFGPTGLSRCLHPPSTNPCTVLKHAISLSFDRLNTGTPPPVNIISVKISTGRVVIGNFQLLPIAHANQAWSPTLASPISPTVETLHALHQHQPAIPHHSVPERHDMLQPSTGKPVASPRGIAVAFGGGLIAGVLAGLLVCQLFSWARLAWWRRCDVWEKHAEGIQENHETSKMAIEDCPKDDNEVGVVVTTGIIGWLEMCNSQAGILLSLFPRHGGKRGWL